MLPNVVGTVEDGEKKGIPDEAEVAKRIQKFIMNALVLAVVSLVVNLMCCFYKDFQKLCYFWGISMSIDFLIFGCVERSFLNSL